MKLKQKRLKLLIMIELEIISHLKTLKELLKIESQQK